MGVEGSSRKAGCFSTGAGGSRVATEAQDAPSPLLAPRLLLFQLQLHLNIAALVRGRRTDDFFETQFFVKLDRRF